MPAVRAPGSQQVRRHLALHMAQERARPIGPGRQPAPVELPAQIARAQPGADRTLSSRPPPWRVRPGRTDVSRPAMARPAASPPPLRRCPYTARGPAASPPQRRGTHGPATAGDPPADRRRSAGSPTRHDGAGTGPPRRAPSPPATRSSTTEGRPSSSASEP
jgi:hypothetical protein